MKKLYTRIAACSLAVLIAFNTVAIPKAEAVITESALVSAFVATYSAAAGFAYRGEEFPGTSAAVAIAQQLDAGAAAFAETKQMVKEEFDSIVASGIEFVGDGVLKISAEASDLLSGFTQWLVDVLWVANGMTGSESVAIVPGSVPDGFAFYGGAVLPKIETIWTDREAYPYAYIIDYSTRTDLDFDYILRLASHPAEQQTDGRWLLPSSNSWRVREYLYYAGDSEFTLSGDSANDYAPTNYPIVDRASNPVIWSNVDMLNMDGTLYLAGSACGASEDWENPVLYATLSSDYEAPPKVEEQYAMVLDTGLTFNDEQEFVDSVLSGMLAGTLAPTYTIEQAAGGDVVVPDEGEDTDTQAGILSSVKNIAQNVIALPQTIAEAIKGLFVPDAALTTEITDAFAAKFSFVPTLHRLGTDLLSIGPDSKPPVVYIHLEDAEGAIDYGGTTKALDMSWYQRYKEDGDRIIGGFLWLGFLWLLFKRVPAIINGGEMVQEYTAAIDRGSKRRKH